MARLRLPMLGFLLMFFVLCIEKVYANTGLAPCRSVCCEDVLYEYKAQIAAMTAAPPMMAAETTCYNSLIPITNTCYAKMGQDAAALVALTGTLGAVSGTGAMGSDAAIGGAQAGTAGVGAGTITGQGNAASAQATPCASGYGAGVKQRISAHLQLDAATGAATTAQASTMSKALSALKSPWVLGAAAVGAGLGYFLGKGSGGDKNEDGNEKEPTETPAIPEPAVAEAPPTSSAASSVSSQATVVQASETIVNPGVMLSPLGGDNDSDGDTSMTVAQATPYQQDFESTTSSSDSLGDDDTTTLGAGGGSQNTALASGGDDDSASAGRALAGANNNTDAAGAKPTAGAGGGAGMGGFSFDSGAGASAAATGSGGQMLMGTPGGRKLASGSSSSRSVRRNLAMVVNNLAKSITLVPANSASALPALTPAQERSRLLNTMQSRGLIRRPASAK